MQAYRLATLVEYDGGMDDTQPPTNCQNCGGKNVVRVAWGFGSALTFISRNKYGEIELILGGQKRPDNAPNWVCLDCQPSWSQVHQLAIEEEEYQRQMEMFIAKADFESARESR